MIEKNFKTYLPVHFNIIFAILVSNPNNLKLFFVFGYHRVTKIEMHYYRNLAEDS